MFRIWIALLVVAVSSQSVNALEGITSKFRKYNWELLSGDPGDNRGFGCFIGVNKLGIIFQISFWEGRDFAPLVVSTVRRVVEEATLEYQGLEYQMDFGVDTITLDGQPVVELLKMVKEMGTGSIFVSRKFADGTFEKMGYPVSGFKENLAELTSYCPVDTAFEEEYLAANKYNKPSVSPVREPYVRKMLWLYHSLLWCVDDGLLGSFDRSFVKRSFLDKRYNNLTSNELEYFSDGELMALRSLERGDICEASLGSLIFSGGANPFSFVDGN